MHITVAIIYVKKMLSENNELIDFLYCDTKKTA